MAKSSQVNTQKEVKVPIWLLQAIVEREWEEKEDIRLTVEAQYFIKFPEYDSTIEAMNILEKEGIEFKKGKWKMLS